VKLALELAWYVLVMPALVLFGLAILERLVFGPDDYYVPRSSINRALQEKLDKEQGL
jgi:hypothetical protein